MATRLAQALRVMPFVRPLLVGRAEKKAKRKVEPLRPIAISKDILNIFEKKSDPQLFPLDKYPPFLKELVYDQRTAMDVSYDILEGYHPTLRAQQKLLLYLKRSRHKIISEHRNSILSTNKETNECEEKVFELGRLSLMRDSTPAGEMRQGERDEEEHDHKKTEDRKKAEELRKKKEEALKTLLEEKKEAEAARLAEERAIRKKGFKIGDKRVQRLTREDIKLELKERREKRRLQKMSAQERERYTLAMEEKAKKGLPPKA